MSKYIEENLGQNEKVVIEAKFSPLCFIPKVIGIVFGVIIYFAIVGAWDKVCETMEKMGELPAPNEVTAFIKVMAATFALIPIIINIIGILSIKNMTLAITNKRVIGKVGIFSIKALDYPIDKVDNVSLSAGIFGRIFKYYTLSVKSAAGGFVNPNTGVAMGINFVGVTNAVEFKNSVSQAIELHAEEARRMQAEEIAKAMSKNN